MKKKDVEIGGYYTARVSGNKGCRIRITSESRYGGWEAINLETGRSIRIRSAQRLRSRINFPQENRNV